MTPTNTQGSEQDSFADAELIADMEHLGFELSHHEGIADWFVKNEGTCELTVVGAREMLALIKSDREADYLSHFSYIDWDSGDDDKLRVGDFINCNHQEPVNGNERNFEGQIEAHQINGLPVILYNLDPKDPDNSGEYADLQSLMMDGWEFSRLAQLSKEDSNHA